MIKENEAYLKAQEEWDQRIGNAQTQLHNWRLIAGGLLCLSLLLLLALILVASKHKEYVYIAQVAPNQNVVNAVSLSTRLSPTRAQEAYFISQFINETMQLPLDPVVARNNWLSAYQKVNGQAIAQLNIFAKSMDPLAHLGNQTATVQITDFHPLSDHSIQFTWTQTLYDNQGQVLKQTLYTGLFTVQQAEPPKDVKDILNNPFGLKIIYFSINSEA